MIICWLLLASIGIVTARYGKPLLPEKHFFGLKIWFQIHRTCMTLVLGLVILSVLLVIVEAQGYSHIPSIPGKQYYHIHPPLGLFVTFLTIANPVMALFRPAPDSQHRQVFNGAHWAVGVIAAVLAVVTMFIGLDLPKAGSTSKPVIVLVFYVVYFIVFLVAVEILPSSLKTIAAKQNKFELKPHLNLRRRSSSKSYDVTTVSAPIVNQPPPTVEQENRVKCILLLVHYIVSFMLSVTMVILLLMH